METASIWVKGMRHFGEASNGAETPYGMPSVDHFWIRKTRNDYGVCWDLMIVSPSISEQTRLIGPKNLKALKEYFLNRYGKTHKVKFYPKG